MYLPRIIACLDVRRGRVVKGVNFRGLKELGDAVDLAGAYARDGADELVWLDIVATIDDRELAVDLIQKARARVDIPMTVGGGIRTLADVKALLEAGADKVSINSQALAQPTFIAEVARRWGSQCVVVAIDAKREGDHWQVYSHGGRKRTRWGLVDWLVRAQAEGCGEFLLTSMDADGTRHGYDLAMLNEARRFIARPLIASGGAGTVAHLQAAMKAGHQAVLLASILHQGQIGVAEIKQQLQQAGVMVRWPIL